MQSKIPRTIKQLEVLLRDKFWIRTILDDDGDRWVYLRDIDNYLGIARPDVLVESVLLQPRFIKLGQVESPVACIFLPRIKEYLTLVGINDREAELIYDHIEATWRDWLAIGIVRDPDGPIRQTYKMVFVNMEEVLEVYSRLYHIVVGEPYDIDKNYLYRMLLVVIKRDHHVDYDDLTNLELITLTNVISMFTAMLLNYLGNKDLQELTPIEGVIETLLYKLRDMFDMAYSTLDVIEDYTIPPLKEADLLYNRS